MELRRSEDSAGFFLVGGFLNEAVDIIISNIQDIQLALLCCKLMETGKERPVFTRIVNKYFIETGKLTNDIFLEHIGYNLLG